MADTRRELSALQTLFADNTSGAITAQSGRDSIISAHGSQVVQTGPYASFPSPPVTGDLFYTETMVWRYSGSAWVPFGPVFQFTDPTLQTFAWINQDLATVDSTYGGVYLSRAQSTATDELCIRKKAVPQAAPWSVVARVQVIGDAINCVASMGGLVFRASGSGAVQFFGISWQNNGIYLYSRKYSPASTFSANYLISSANMTDGGKALTHGGFLKVQDDGTNRICSYSFDGQHWVVFHSVGRTDFLTADEVGFAVNQFANGAGTVGLLLQSWKEGT